MSVYEYCLETIIFIHAFFLCRKRPWERLCCPSILLGITFNRIFFSPPLFVWWGYLASIHHEHTSRSIMAKKVIPSAFKLGFYEYTPQAVSAVAFNSFYLLFLWRVWFSQWRSCHKALQVRRRKWPYTIHLQRISNSQPKKNIYICKYIYNKTTSRKCIWRLDITHSTLIYIKLCNKQQASKVPSVKE